MSQTDDWMKRTRENQPVLLGSLEEQVMLAVLRTRDEAYGMAVRRELEKVTERAITIGSVYATLDRLEAKGLVASSRTPLAPDVSRRVFTVTPAGARSLALTRATRDRLWRGVQLKPSLEGE
jgi:PadR family transcriptional regulator PadR